MTTKHKNTQELDSSELSQMLAVVKLLQDSAIKQLDLIPKGDLTLQTIVDLVRANLTKSMFILENINSANLPVAESMVIGTNLYDFSFKEFKVNSKERVVSINGKSVTVPEAEFSFLSQLLKTPNKRVILSPNDVARTNIARLRSRIPEFKELIQSTYGEGGYTLKVTPIR